MTAPDGICVLWKPAEGRIFEAEIACRANADAVARRLMTVTGIGLQIAVLAPPPETVCKARDFAA